MTRTAPCRIASSHWHQIALAPAPARGRIALLEPLLSQPFGLNLLEVRAPINDNDDPVTWVAESVLAAFKKLYRGGGDAYQPRLEYYLPLAARTLAYHQATLAQLPELFEDPVFRQACLASLPSSDRVTRAQWAAFERLSPRDRGERIDALLSRIIRLLQVAVIGRILASSQTTVPFDAVLNGHGLILLRLSSEWLPREECDLLGTLFLAALADRVFARSVSGGGTRRLHVYVDEYQRFATPTVGELFTQGRKFGVGLTIAHQGRDQIDDERVRSAEVHAGALVLLRLTRADAAELAGELPIRPRPEWTEEVVEADGTEPVLAASSHAVQDLMAGRHPDPLAQAAGGVFRDVTQRIGGLIKQADRYVRPPGAWLRDELYECSLQQAPGDLHRGLTRIDALFVDVMRGQLDPRTPPALHGMVDILDDLRCYLSGDSQLTPAYVSGSIKCGRQDVGSWAEDLQGLLEETRCAELSRWAAAFFTAAARRGLDKGEDWRTGAVGTDPDPVFVVLHAIARRIADRYWYSRGQPPPGADAMVNAVYHTALILHKHPLLVATNMVQPRMRTRSVTHPGQPYQDAQNELVDRLVNPVDDYLAHYKGPRAGEYHVVKLRDPLSGGDVAAIERVRQTSKARFGLPPEPPRPPGPGTPTPPTATRPKPRQPGQQPPPDPDLGPPPIGRR